MNANDPIVVNRDILNGTLAFKGARVPVKTLFDCLEGNYSFGEFLECFPSVTREMGCRLRTFGIPAAHRMRILLDECLRSPMHKLLVGHECTTSQKRAWGGIKNGDLLHLAEEEFDLSSLPTGTSPTSRTSRDSASKYLNSPRTNCAVSSPPPLGFRPPSPPSNRASSAIWKSHDFHQLHRSRRVPGANCQPGQVANAFSVLLPGLPRNHSLWLSELHGLRATALAGRFQLVSHVVRSRVIRLLAVLPILLVGLLCARFALGAQPPGGALAGERFRVIVSTDIGGSDPDDFQSMVHYLVYADVFDTEGLIASPPHAGRKLHIFETLDAYAADHPRLRQHSDRFPVAGALRAVVKQGAVDAAPPAGCSTPTEGSRWIIERAHAKDPRPLWILVWGSITDVAQALHDDPGIKPKLRVYFISSWNRRMDPAARDYVVGQHRDLWLIEADTTFRGMYVGGDQAGDLGNREFVIRHVRGRGALGDLFFAKKPDIKMGDTPSVLYLLRGETENPAGESWGGSFVRPDPSRPYWTDNRDPALRERNYAGAKTVNRWRADYLRDWQQRMQWLKAP